MASIEPHLLAFTVICNPLSLRVDSTLAGLKKPLTSNGRKYGKRDGIEVLRLGCNETAASVSGVLPCCLACSLWWKPVTCCERPMGEPHGKNWGKPSANSQPGTEALSPTTCEELNLVNNHVSELENRSFLSQVFTWPLSDRHLGCNLLRDLRCKHPAKPLLGFWPTETVWW